MYKRIIFIVVLLACFTPWVTPPIALLLGIIIAQTIGHPFFQWNKKATTLLLQCSVVGLGFGQNIHEALKVGGQGVVFAIISIATTLLLGYLLGKWLHVEKKTSYLISAGTAICGGSAIAAISPIIKAEEKQISVAMGTIFILNSIALFLFPFIGHLLELSQSQFGMWCAIAIHDTSSVVGAASKYGDQALAIATTVKLARALWIIPLAFVSTFIFKNKDKKIKIPYFIAYYVLAMIISSYVPMVKEYSHYITYLAKIGLTVTLFLIGSGLNREVLKSVGVKPLVQGVIVWIFISVMALWAVMGFVS